MKVKIPNYINWFGPYQLLDPLEKVLIELGKTEDEAYDIVHKIAERIPEKPFAILHKFRKNLPWNKRVIKIDKWDTWGMDSTLAPIIVPMLKQLKETKHGVPCEFAHVGGENWDSQLSFDWYAEDTNKLFEEHAERRWNEVMDKMIWSFEQIILKEESGAYFEDYWEPMTKEEIEEKMRDPSSVYHSLKFEPAYKINDLKYEVYHTRLREGLELFGKHYQSLWD